MVETQWLRGLDPDSFVLLAPPGPIPPGFTRVRHHDSEYERWLKRAQILRGRTYLADRAIHDSQADENGGLISCWDRQSWHVIARDGEEACATMRLTFHRERVHPQRLGMAHCSIFRGADASRSWQAVDDYQRACLSNGYVFGEVGGWASAKSCRGSRRSVGVVLSCWPICRAQGRVMALSTVTVRSKSIEMLTHLGATPLSDPLGQVGPWFDTSYGCEMHISRLSSCRLNERYEPAARQLSEILACAQLYASTSGEQFRNGRGDNPACGV